jgi:hypothetical protein
MTGSSMLARTALISILALTAGTAMPQDDQQAIKSDRAPATAKSETEMASDAFECKDNLETWVGPAGTPGTAGRFSMGLWLFESSTSGNSFTMGVLIQNRSPFDYFIRKEDAMVHFTKYAVGRTWDSVPYATANRVASAPVVVTSWEDGESPALRLSPCERKWLRLSGVIEGAEAAKFATGPVEQVSIALSRLLTVGWGTSPSLTVTLNAPNFVDPLQKALKASAPQPKP